MRKKPSWVNNSGAKERARILGVTDEPECRACSEWIYCGTVTVKHTCREQVIVMNLQDLVTSKVRPLTEKMKVEICKLCREQLKDPVNEETDGMILSTWVISLLENIHNYPEWFK